jgi:hypothetical protein
MAQTTRRDVFRTVLQYVFVHFSCVEMRSHYRVVQTDLRQEQYIYEEEESAAAEEEEEEDEEEDVEEDAEEEKLVAAAVVDYWSESVKLTHATLLSHLAC